MIQASRRQWIKFSIVIILYLLFLVWVRSWLGLLVVPFIFDAYITKFIPWDFWKKSKNPVVRSVMSWVDAIIFALVAVYFVNIYFFQNYQIPSSSLEKTLLVGDFLFVSKMSYGPRVPNTPLSMPLAQHTLPVINTKSYIEYPQWPYKRVKGFGDVKLNDIVVFNFPAGDTVALNYQHSDFYSMAYLYGADKLRNTGIIMDNLNREQQRQVYDAYYAAGRKIILDYPQEYGKIVYRPVDRRENYVKRCVGLPGDTLQIKDRLIYLNGESIKEPENVQFGYYVYTTGRPIPAELFRELGISNDDIRPLNKENTYYSLPLTHTMHAALLARTDLISKIENEPQYPSGSLYPQNLYKKWTLSNYGPIWIPKKGARIHLTLDNLPIYERPIRNYENNKLEVKEGGDIYINGVKTDTYTFKMDYYWMMGDNRHNSADSRMWGFVPEDHVVGKPLVIWLSLDKDRGWFNGKIRWNRIFKLVSNID